MTAPILREPREYVTITFMSYHVELFIEKYFDLYVNELLGR